jgi:heterodisulfide reductase subunit A-like polyferredoxin
VDSFFWRVFWRFGGEYLRVLGVAKRLPGGRKRNRLGKGLSRGTGMAQKYDVIVIGGGHNGLTNAAYLGKAGKKVLVVERRHVLGGAAVTEEIVPKFLFSECSYVVSLLRPEIIRHRCAGS